MFTIKANLHQLKAFLLRTSASFRDVLVIHAIILFLIIPLLSNGTKFILKFGKIDYLSFDSIGRLISSHPFVTLSLIGMLIFLLAVLYFEFTFLLLSLFFIKKEVPISLFQLIQITFWQLKKLRFDVFLFFLFYYLLVLPLGGFSYHSSLLTKIKLPAFLIDFIFVNRLMIVSFYLFIYAGLIYIGIRLIFSLPGMILLNYSLKNAIRESLLLTKKKLFVLIGRFSFLSFSLLTLSSITFSIIFSVQRFIEEHFNQYALQSAVFAMFLIQFIFLVNLVLSTILIFFLLIERMDEAKLLPEISPHFLRTYPEKQQRNRVDFWYLIVLSSFVISGVLVYNYQYLTNVSNQTIQTLSHRGVSNKNGVQNSLAALKQTSQLFKPDYVEMDIQMTVDQEFIVFHDFNYKSLTNTSGVPEQMTLREGTALTSQENGYAAAVTSFDDYLEEAKSQQQRLLIEIKTQRKNTQELTQLFLKNYEERIKDSGHWIQSLSYSVVEELKTSSPELFVGYIMPFNFIGPPKTQADFLTMEYSTLNKDFINVAHQEGKKVIAWTPNQLDTMERMAFYGVDGIITDRMDLLNQMNENPQKHSYADKLLHFVIGIG